jgi:TolB protein
MKALHNLALLSTLLIVVITTGCAQSTIRVNNGKIVFQSDRDGNYNLWIMNLDGSELKNLTDIPPSSTDARTNVGPVPSPDGERIAFISNRDGDNEIYVIDIESGIQQNLTENKANDYSPTWSPDGKQIAFVSDRDTIPVAPERGIWSNNIYIMNADGSGARRLTINNVTAGYNGLAWSPDGMKLALNLSDLTSSGSYFASGINLMTISNSSLVALTLPSDNMSCCAKWSPDGNHILYSVVDRGFENIYVMKADGTDQVALTQESAYYDIDPSWSPDGEYILFSSNRDGQYHIYMMNADGSNQQRLTNGPGEDRYPVWLPMP